MNSLAEKNNPDKRYCEPCGYLRHPKKTEATAIVEDEETGFEYEVCELHFQEMLTWDNLFKSSEKHI